MNCLKRRAWCVLFALGLACGNVAATPLADGLAALDREDYAQALEILRPLAEGGNMVAQSNLAWMYSHGKGVDQDYTVALKWSLLAADKGDAVSEVAIGIMYERGRGVVQNYAEAVKWFRRASNGSGSRRRRMKRVHRPMSA